MPHSVCVIGCCYISAAPRKLLWQPCVGGHGDISCSPAHLHIAHVGVEVEQGADADGMGHDLVELRPLGRVQIQHVEDELPQLGAVAVRYGGKSPTHDLQDQGRKVLQTDSTVDAAYGCNMCAYMTAKKQ